MKNLSKLFLAVVLVFTFTGCGNDDDAGPTSIPLEGTSWEGVSYTATNCDDPADNEDSSYTCTATNCEVLVLSGGTFTVTNTENGVTETFSGTYTVSGNTLTVSFTDSGITVSFDIIYSIAGNLLTMTFTDPFDGCNVVQVYSADV